MEILHRSVCDAETFKELTRVIRTWDQVETKEINFLVFQQFYLNFAVFLSNFYSNVDLTEFHSLLKWNFEEKSYVLPLY